MIALLSGYQQFLVQVACQNLIHLKFVVCLLELFAYFVS
jgi:hypothetical protein